MNRKSFLLRNTLSVVCTSFLFLLQQNVQAQKNVGIMVSEQPGHFAVASVDDEAAHIVVDGQEHDVVRIAAEMFSSDVSSITGNKPDVGDAPVKGRANILVGTIGVSNLIGELERQSLIETANVRGKWETFGIKEITYQGDPCLAVYGSDSRGTAYGLMELTRAMGVHPWTWWADIAPEQKEAIYISTSGGGVFGPPSVKYRGIFINDEDWGLQPWAAVHADTDIKDIGPNTYKKVFELMLRMKANYLWPAMHPCTKAFWYYKGSPELAKRYDIVMGSSHCEPLLRNNVDEWTNNYTEEYGRASGDWNWNTNRDNIVTYWTDRVKESKENDAIYTMGMRGIHDSSMPGYGTNEEKRQALMDVIQTQRSILFENLGKDVTEVPQMFNPYKEALTLYRMGLNLADDITLVWPDDNFGYIRQLSNPEEQKRSGGGGVYYHFSYWGIPNDHLWLSSVSPVLASYELCKAYDQNCKTIWIYNVGDIKPHELEAQFGMDLAWNIEQWRPENAHKYPYYWALEIFGDENLAERIAGLKKEYYRLAASGKPEQIHDVHYTEPEIKQRLEDYKKLADEAQAVGLVVPARLRDAYFQLIEYPCRAAASMNEKILLARLSFISAARGEGALALAQGQEAKKAYGNIVDLTSRYNKEMSNGKWDGIMSYAPRGLKHFYEPNTASEKDINKYEMVAPAVPNIHKVNLVDYSASNGNIKAVYGLGIADTSVTVLPLDMQSYDASSIHSAPFVEYSVPVNKGYNKIKVKFLPTFPVYDGLDLRYALSVEGAAPVFKSIKMEAETSPWSNNVQTGFSYGEHSYVADQDKAIKIRLYMASPGLVLSEIEVTRPDNSPFTAMLVNPDFEYKAEGVLNEGVVTRGDVYGWKRTGNINGNSYGLSSDAAGYQGTSICWYNSTPMPDYFELSQTIKNIPSGEYIVRCKLGVFKEQYSTQRLFANNVVQYYGEEKFYDKNIDKSESYSFAGHSFGPKDGSKGELHEMAVRVVVLDGEDLTVGIRSGNLLADATKATNNAGWFKVDDFRIDFVREINKDCLLNDLDSLVSAAEWIRDTTKVGNMSGQYPQESRDLFEQSILDAKGKHAAATSLSEKELIQTIQTLEQAIADYLGDVIDYNAYIVNRSFEYKAEGIKNDGSTVRGIPYGWLSEGTLLPDNWGNQSYGINNDAVNIVGENCCWINSKVMPEPFELYQVIKGLPAGDYKVGCRMANFTDLVSTQRLFANNNVTYFGTENDYDKNLTPGEVNSFAGHTPTEPAELKEMSVEVTLKEGEDLRIGIRSGNRLKDGTVAQNNAGWFKVDEFTLEYIGNGITTGGGNIRNDVAELDKTIDVYNLNGVKIRNKVRASKALDGLKNGIYIIEGKKVVL